MKLKEEQMDEIKDAVDDALNDVVPHFIGSTPLAILTTAMEASIGHVDFPDGRTAGIILRIEIETEEDDQK